MSKTSDLQKIVRTIRSNLRNPDVSFWQHLEGEANILLRRYIDQGDELNANKAWFTTTVITAYKSFCKSFDIMRSGIFYDAWCLLERIELALDNLRRNFEFAVADFKLEYLRKRVEAYQSLFPYKIYFSPEMIVGKKECSICQTIITPWSDCGHEPGKVYAGQCCHRIAKDVNLVSISVVTNPVQKYSVVRTVADENGNERDPHDYSLITFVICRLSSPFDGWSARWTKAYHPHALFSHVSEDDLCPCGSGATYSNCCRSKPGVMRPHLHVEFQTRAPSDLPNFEFVGYARSPLPGRLASKRSPDESR